MRRSKGGALLALSLFALSVLMVPASAHMPSELDLSYDPVAEELRVIFTHAVVNPATHYVREVEVDVVGGARLLEREYTSQPTANTFTYTYPLVIAAGTQVMVKGECNLGGEISRTLFIGEVTTTTTTTPMETDTPTVMTTATIPPPTTTQAPGFVFLATILVLVAVAGILSRYR